MRPGPRSDIVTLPTAHAGLAAVRAARQGVDAQEGPQRAYPPGDRVPAAMRTIHVTRYVTPLREGGSLPAIVEADDAGLYVMKFRGAGQGTKALIAELVAGEIARALGLLVPEIVFAQLDPVLGRNEPHDEIRDLLKASGGLNLALDYLPGSLAFDPLVPGPLEPLLASSIVWFDAFVMNVDRTPRNPNLLAWHKRLWLIDHGAALYFHHAWTNYRESSRSPFAAIKDHVLLPFAGALAEAGALLRAKLDEPRLAAIVAGVPDEWLAGEPAFESPQALRAAYVDFLCRRLEASTTFLEEASRARARHV